MATGSVQVGCTENLNREKIKSGEKLHPHPRVKFQIRVRTRRISGARRIC
jgi:hypothetical protein